MKLEIESKPTTRNLERIVHEQLQINASDPLKKSGEFLTALPGSEQLLTTIDHGMVYIDPLLHGSIHAKVGWVVDQADGLRYAFLDFVTPNLPKESLESDIAQICKHGISMERQGNVLRFVAPMQWSSSPITHHGDPRPRQTRHPQVLFWADIPIDDEIESFLEQGEKLMKKSKALVIPGASSALVALGHIIDDLDAIGLDLNLTFTPEAKNMIKSDVLRGQNKMFNPDKQELLAGLVVDSSAWVSMLESGNWAKGEHAHISIGKTHKIIIFAPATSNTIGALSSGLTKDVILYASAATSPFDASVYIAPASEMIEDVRVQSGLEELLNYEIWRYRLLPDQIGQLAGKRRGPGRLMQSTDIAQKVFEWTLFDHCMQKSGQSTSFTQPSDFGPDISNQAILLAVKNSAGTMLCKR